MRTQRGAALPLAVVSLLLAASAEAKVKCERVGPGDRTLKVTLGQDQDDADIARDGVEIAVIDLGPNAPVSCDGGGGLVPTVTNTDTVKVRDKSADGRNALFITDFAAFGPGATDAGDDAGGSTENEIEFDIELGGAGQDVLVLRGSSGADKLAMGRKRANPNAFELFPDADIFYAGVGRFEVSPGADNDLASGAGSAVTGEPLRRPLSVLDSPGDDLLVGGNGRDALGGGPGADSLHGGKGDDWLTGSSGPDLLNGGPGNDFASYFRGVAPEDILIDIGVGGDNDGGPHDGPPGARDEVTGSVENLFVRTGGDVQVLGDDDRNVIDAAGGMGIDTLISGLGANDRLIGRRSDDTIVGGLGVDTLLGLRGDDALLAQDGIRDRRIDCGKGNGDFAETDAKDPEAHSC